MTEKEPIKLIDVIERALDESWGSARSRMVAVGLREVARLRSDACICDTNPDTTDGADRDCRHHGAVASQMHGKETREAFMERNGLGPEDMHDDVGWPRD